MKSSSCVPHFDKLQPIVLRTCTWGTAHSMAFYLYSSTYLPTYLPTYLVCVVLCSQGGFNYRSVSRLPSSGITVANRYSPRVVVVVVVVDETSTGEAKLTCKRHSQFFFLWNLKFRESRCRERNDFTWMVWDTHVIKNYTVDKCELANSSLRLASSAVEVAYTTSHRRFAKTFIVQETYMLFPGNLWCQYFLFWDSGDSLIPAANVKPRILFSNTWISDKKLY